MTARAEALTFIHKSEFPRLGRWETVPLDRTDDRKRGFQHGYTFHTPITANLCIRLRAEARGSLSLQKSVKCSNIQRMLDLRKGCTCGIPYFTTLQKITERLAAMDGDDSDY